MFELLRKQMVLRKKNDITVFNYVKILRFTKFILNSVYKTFVHL